MPTGSRLGGTTGCLSASDTTARTVATAADRSGLSTLTTLMILLGRMAVIMLAFRLDAA